MRSKRLAVLFGAVALGLVAASIGTAFYLSAIAGRPSVMIVNGTGQSLRDVRCVLRANGSTWEEKIADLNPGESIRFSKSVSDLFVTSLDFTLNSAHVVWSDGGIATTGETLLLTVQDDGRVSLRYAR